VQCELRVLEWRVYCRSAPADAKPSDDPDEPRHEPNPRAVAPTVDALAAQARKLQQEDALCVLATGAGAASGEDELWVFRINSGSQGGKGSAASDIAATSDGEILGNVWTQRGTLMLAPF
jgi:hypothetical protein